MLREAEVLFSKGKTGGEVYHELNISEQNNNNEPTHQGKRCEGKTPIQTFLDGLQLVDQKNLDTKFERQLDTCQV